MQLQAKVSQTDTRLITLNWEPKEFQNNVLNIRSVACLTVIVLKQIDLCSLPKASTWLKKHSISFPGSFSFQRWPLLSLFSPFHNFTGIKEKQKKYPTWVFKHRNISLLKWVMVTQSHNVFKISEKYKDFGMSHERVELLLIFFIQLWKAGFVICCLLMLKISTLKSELSHL